MAGAVRGLVGAVLILTLGLIPAPLRAAEEILDWHSQITVAADGSMTVTETIAVRSEANRIKRGIYRDFPTVYRDRAGNRVRVGFDLLSVNRDGRPEPYHTKGMSNGLRIYMGEESVYLDPGEYTYRLTYRTHRQLGHFENHDELYWNVTGNGWIFPIRRATATVSLPAPVEARAMMMEGYVGPEGSRERSVTWEVSGPGQVSFASRRALGPGEGLTIVLGWPKGLVTEPTRGQKAAGILRDNRAPAVGALGLIVITIYYFLTWKRVGKDPEKGTIIPRFTPPDNLSPAAMRYIMEMGFDNRAFASAVISLAVKGYLTIRDESRALGFVKTFTLEKTGTEPAVSLSRGEQKVARKLFPGHRKTLTLEKENHKRISGAIDALRDLLEADYQKAHFLNNKGYFGLGLLISVAFLITAGLLGERTGQGPPLVFVVLWLTPWTVATGFLWTMRRFFMAAAFTFFLVAATVAFAAATSIAFVAGIFALILVNMFFYHLLKAPTSLGRRVMDRVEGFRMYLATAEEHRLAKLHPPEKTPELFERYLPYALALEVDQEWSEKFTDVLRRAAETREYSPSWYHGSHWDSRHAAQFGSSLGSSLSTAVSSSSQAPGSSSGFGGGSSGGGGGGGGGGGW